MNFAKDSFGFISLAHATKSRKVSFLSEGDPTDSASSQTVRMLAWMESL